MKTLAEETYALLLQVPKGHITTYKALAYTLHTNAYRAIGQIMRKNPYAPIVPCHRVVRSDGKIGGYMGKTKGAQVEKKIKLLQSEGIIIQHGKVVNFEKFLFRFA